VGELLINKTVCSKLSPDIQEMIRTAALASMMETYTYNVYKNAAAVKTLREKHKVEVHDTPKDFFGEYLKAANTVLNRYADKDPFFKQVLTSQREFAATVVPYWTKILVLYSELGAAALQKPWEPKPAEPAEKK
jgi:TRAP-type mannitol/chloroaromatic compound transport system substrate-binding protein